VYMRLSNVACKPAGKLILWHPLDTTTQAEKLVRFKVANVPAVHWWNLHVSHGGSFLSGPDVSGFLDAQVNQGWVDDQAMGADSSNEAARERKRAAWLGDDQAVTLEWYFRVYMRLSNVACKPAGKLILWHPLDTTTQAEKLVRFKVANVPAVHWWNLHVTHGGSFLSGPDAAWIHSHRARYGGGLIVAGNHTLWSLLLASPSGCMQAPHASSSPHQGQGKGQGQAQG